MYDKARTKKRINCDVGGDGDEKNDVLIEKDTDVLVLMADPEDWNETSILRAVVSATVDGKNICGVVIGQDILEKL